MESSWQANNWSSMFTEMSNDYESSTGEGIKRKFAEREVDEEDWIDDCRKRLREVRIDYNDDSRDGIRNIYLTPTDSNLDLSSYELIEQDIDIPLPVDVSTVKLNQTETQIMPYTSNPLPTLRFWVHPSLKKQLNAMLNPSSVVSGSCSGLPTKSTDEVNGISYNIEEGTDGPVEEPPLPVKFVPGVNLIHMLPDLSGLESYRKANYADTIVPKPVRGPRLVVEEIHEDDLPQSTIASSTAIEILPEDADADIPIPTGVQTPACTFSVTPPTIGSPDDDIEI